MSLFRDGEHVFEKTVSEFVEEIYGNNYSIPSFQRRYVWDNKKIFSLLESLYDGHNIGTVVFWDSKFTNLSRNVHNFAPSLSDGMLCYVVDGQQRSLTLYSLFSENNIVGIDKDKIFIIFSSETNSLSFEGKPPKSNEGQLYIKFSEFIKFFYNRGPGSYNLVEKFNDEYISNERLAKIADFQTQLEIFKRNLKKKKLIVGYKVQLSPDNLDLAITQFEKINDSGIKLNHFQILNAMAFSDNQYMLEEMQEKLVIGNFGGVIDKGVFTTDFEKIIVNSYILIKNFNDSNGEKISMLTNAIANFSQGDSQILDSIFSLTIDLINTIKKFKINSLEEMPYTLNAVAYIFLMSKYKSLVTSKHDLLIRIMLQTGLGRSYDKSSSSNLVKDLKVIVKDLQTNKPVYFMAKGFKVTPEDIKKTKFNKKLSSYEKTLKIFMQNDISLIPLSKTPNDIKYNDEIVLERIFPKVAEFKKADYADCFANVFLITKSEADLKGDSRPSSYFSNKHSDAFVEVLETQFITDKTLGFLESDFIDAFIGDRSKKMADKLNNLMAEFERTKP